MVRFFAVIVIMLGLAGAWANWYIWRVTQGTVSAFDVHAWPTLFHNIWIAPTDFASVIYLLAIGGTIVGVTGVVVLLVRAFVSGSRAQAFGGPQWSWPYRNAPAKFNADETEDSEEWLSGLGETLSEEGDEPQDEVPSRRWSGFDALKRFGSSVENLGTRSWPPLLQRIGDVAAQAVSDLREIFAGDVAGWRQGRTSVGGSAGSGTDITADAERPKGLKRLFGSRRPAQPRQNMLLSVPAKSVAERDDPVIQEIMEWYAVWMQAGQAKRTETMERKARELREKMTQEIQDKLSERHGVSGIAAIDALLLATSGKGIGNYAEDLAEAVPQPAMEELIDEEAAANRGASTPMAEDDEEYSEQELRDEKAPPDAGYLDEFMLRFGRQKPRRREERRPDETAGKADPVEGSSGDDAEDDGLGLFRKAAPADDIISGLLGVGEEEDQDREPTDESKDSQDEGKEWNEPLPIWTPGGGVEEHVDASGRPDAAEPDENGNLFDGGFAAEEEDDGAAETGRIRPELMSGTDDAGFDALEGDRAGTDQNGDGDAGSGSFDDAPSLADDAAADNKHEGMAGDAEEDGAVESLLASVSRDGPIGDIAEEDLIERPEDLEEPVSTEISNEEIERTIRNIDPSWMKVITGEIDRGKRSLERQYIQYGLQDLKTRNSFIPALWVQLQKAVDYQTQAYAWEHFGETPPENLRTAHQRAEHLFDIVTAIAAFCRQIPEADLAELCELKRDTEQVRWIANRRAERMVAELKKSGTVGERKNGPAATPKSRSEAAEPAPTPAEETEEHSGTTADGATNEARRNSDERIPVPELIPDLPMLDEGTDSRPAEPAGEMSDGAFGDRAEGRKDGNEDSAEEGDAGEDASEETGATPTSEVDPEQDRSRTDSTGADTPEAPPSGDGRPVAKDGWLEQARERALRDGLTVKRSIRFTVSGQDMGDVPEEDQRVDLVIGARANEKGIAVADRQVVGIVLVDLPEGRWSLETGPVGPYLTDGERRVSLRMHAFGLLSDYYAKLGLGVRKILLVRMDFLAVIEDAGDVSEAEVIERAATEAGGASVRLTLWDEEDWRRQVIEPVLA